VENDLSVEQLEAEVHRNIQRATNIRKNIFYVFSLIHLHILMIFVGVFISYKLIEYFYFSSCFIILKNVLNNLLVISYY